MRGAVGVHDDRARFAGDDHTSGSVPGVVAERDTGVQGPGMTEDAGAGDKDSVPNDRASSSAVELVRFVGCDGVELM